MTRCKEFYAKCQRDGTEWCNKTDAPLSRIENYLKLVREFEEAGIPKDLPIGKVSEGAARLLFRQKNDLVKEKAKQAVLEFLKTGKNPLDGSFSRKLTGKDMWRLFYVLRKRELMLKPVPNELIGKVLEYDIRQASGNVPDQSVDLIITDPRYAFNSLDLWTELAKFAKSKLRQNRLLIAYSGQMFLPNVLQRLSEHLTYVWTFIVLHKGPLNHIQPYYFLQGWKPILIFTNGKYEPRADWKTDIIEGTGREKDLHAQAQALGEAKELLAYFTDENDFVVDPFCGSGTNLLACKELNRRYLGMDIDPEAVKTTLGRLSL